MADQSNIPQPISALPLPFPGFHPPHVRREVERQSFFHHPVCLPSVTALPKGRRREAPAALLPSLGGAAAGRMARGSEARIPEHPLDALRLRDKPERRVKVDHLAGTTKRSEEKGWTGAMKRREEVE